jgi:hypothetical protein
MHADAVEALHAFPCDTLLETINNYIRCTGIWWSEDALEDPIGQDVLLDEEGSAAANLIMEHAVLRGRSEPGMSWVDATSDLSWVDVTSEMSWVDVTSEMSFVHVMSEASSAASLSEVQNSAIPNMSKQEVQTNLPTPWELAVVRSELAGQRYVAHLKKYGPPSPAPLGVKKRQHCLVGRTARREPKRSFEGQLLDKHNTRVAWHYEPQKNAHPGFDQFRRDFLHEHGARCCENLQSCFRGPIEVKPTPLHGHVQQSFFEACHGGLKGSLCPAFHGTATKNLPSIYKHGLLIPGCGNSLKVVHGSAHGLGIYAAKVGSAALSFGFCSGGHKNTSMLICAVLDDSHRTSAFIGRLPVTSESNDIKHVGDALVIFEKRRITPLFVASRYVPPDRSWTLPKRKKRSKLVGPHSSLKPRSSKHDIDRLRRRLIAKHGRSVALGPRTKERKAMS